MRHTIRAVFLSRKILLCSSQPAFALFKEICRRCDKQGIVVPTRGEIQDIGPTVSHKSKIIELYLKGYEYTDIKVIMLLEQILGADNICRHFDN
jgi:hypothetical protein